MTRSVSYDFWKICLLSFRLPRSWINSGRLAENPPAILFSHLMPCIETQNFTFSQVHVHFWVFGCGCLVWTLDWSIFWFLSFEEFNDYLNNLLIIWRIDWLKDIYHIFNFFRWTGAFIKTQMEPMKAVVVPMYKKNISTYKMYVDNWEIH